MKIEFDAEQVRIGLQRLHDVFPQDRVDIWCKVEIDHTKKHHLEFTCYITGRDDLPSICEHGPEVAPCVEATILKAGPRDAVAAIRAKRLEIEKLEAELEKKRAQLDPVLLAIDKAKEDEVKANNPK